VGGGGGGGGGGGAMTTRKESVAIANLRTTIFKRSVLSRVPDKENRKIERSQIKKNSSN